MDVASIASASFSSSSWLGFDDIFQFLISEKSHFY